MTDSMMLNLIQSFLAAPPGTASPEERQAWEDFYHVHDPMIRAAIRARHEGWNVVDDLAQNVWCIMIERLPDLRVDPARDSLKAWVTQVARRVACGHARDRSRCPSFGSDLV
jgi:DNA-directed RNA polymerase specialized sigma24 family protein